MKQKLKIFAVPIAIFLALIGYVFFAYTPDGGEMIASVVEATEEEELPQKLTFLQSANFGDLDPQRLAVEDEVAIGLIYEPLVRFDEFMNIKPALAFAWFFRNPTDFVTEIRSDAKFHDGSDVDCRDVAASLDRAQNFPNSNLREVFAGVEVSFDENSSKVCEFKLPEEDFNFVRKLTRLFILPSEIAAESTEFFPQKIIGSGRYQLDSRGQKDLNFVRFEDFRDFDERAPRQIHLLTESEKYKRLARLKAGEVDVLLDTPSSFVTQIDKRYGFDIESVPNYESIFLLFNFGNERFADSDFRSEFQSLVGSIPLEEILEDDGLYSLAQFAPSGVFGFSPDLIDSLSDSVAAPEDKIFFSVAVADSYKKLAEILQAELARKNIELSLDFLSSANLLTSLQNGDHDVYLLGWRFGLGMVDDFFTKLVHSSDENFGELNGYGFKSSGVDSQISTALAENKTNERLSDWQNLMEKIVRDEVIGAPLLGTRRLYSVREGLDIFQPRMDGLVILDF